MVAKGVSDVRRDDAAAGTRDHRSRAGTPQTKTTKSFEWVCPECDYFEEDEDDEDG